ncbi:MAG: hypothetical protein J6R77_03105 [Clostridia bacterium]|nr:hypothetical protein [Clostridia bacterium]
MKTISLLLTLVIMLGLLAGCSTVKEPDTDNTLHWVSEESFFVDYEITDNDIVKFRYSICFVNNSAYDLTVSLSARFSEKDLKGWLKYEDFFWGYDENHSPFYTEIKSGEKANVVFVFEGEYLGGSVNEKLSFPEEIILTHSFSDD